ncbi:YybH family protein [Spirosoma spitsbergense]|uniref:YybH family protein n=1 Tax=Spirosoma spitsbergense TaxID=431554 RepID=UPI0003786198|nr:nuclear transport factor 2 family protein [Spirosoma spitsbergense]
MKTHFLTLALLASALMATTQTTRAQSSDVAQIKAVVERETTAWNNRDAASMADCWANVPEAGNLISLWDGKGTVIHSNNPQTNMAEGIKTMIASMGKSTGETFQNTDYLIRVNGNAAFAQFEQTVTAPDGKKQYAHETRYLEKMGRSDGSGKWKIVHVGGVFYEPAK